MRLFLIIGNRQNTLKSYRLNAITINPQATKAIPNQSLVSGFSPRNTNAKIATITGVSSSVLSMAELIQKRCTQVLGFEPALKIAEGALNEKQLMLHYRTDKLDAIGIYTRSTGTTQEIDSLLRFCQTAFNKTQIPSS